MASIRNLITNDFRVINARLSRERAHALVAAVGSYWIVVQRDIADGRTDYHAFERTTLQRMLAASSGAGDVNAALPLGAATAVPVVQSSEDIGSLDAMQLVFEGSRLLGMVVPPRPKRRGGGHSAVHEDFALVAEPMTTNTPVTRSLLASLPSRAPQGSRLTLQIWLDANQPAGGAATFAREAGAKIDLLVTASGGLTLVGNGEGTLEVREPQPPVTLEFELRAEQIGFGSARVYAFCNGTAVASLSLATTIVQPGPTAATVAARHSEDARVSLTRRTPPDLSLYIFERGPELSFALQSADGAHEMSKFGPVQLSGSPREHFRAFFRDIENLPLATPANRATAKRRLEQKGANLFRTVLPDDLRAALWELRSAITTVQITSDEPWIPWEMCRLTGTVAGRVEDGPFFAEAFAITRWLYGVSAAPQIGAKKLALVVPGDSGLEHASEEREFVASLGGGSRTVTEVPASYIDVTNAMATGAYDAWHFTGHARADEKVDADQSCIELMQGESLTPEDIVGAVENVLVPRPLVFLNACQSAQGGLSLTGVGGWAQRLLKPNSRRHAASAFIGTYWSVDDESAYLFAKELYTRLLRGDTIGAAARDARLAIRGRPNAQEDPTWLAYTVYADPNATLDRG